MLKSLSFLSLLILIPIVYTKGQSSLIDREVSITKSSGTVEEFLTEISERGEFTFTYSNQLPVTAVITLKSSHATVGDYLNQLFPNGNIKFTPLNNRIALSVIKHTAPKPKVVVSGTVYDEETKEPLPFAHIALLDNSKGVATNIKGEFRLVLPIHHQEDSIKFSFVGFYPKKFKLSDLSQNEKIYMTEDKRILDEVVFKDLSTQQILEKAIERIPENHQKNTHITQGFYRMTAKRENEIGQLSEAVFDIYTEKNGESKPQFRLEKMRLLKDEKVTEGLDMGLRPISVINMDIINDIDDFNLFNKKGLKMHDFTFEETIIYDGKPTYVISFDRKDELTKRVGRKGKVYIDTETFAFVYLEHGFSPKGVHNVKYGSNAFRTLMVIFDIHIESKRNDVQLSYKEIDGSYYLHSVISDERLNLRSDGRHYNFDLDFKIDYVATNTIIDKVEPFTKEETIGKQKLIEGQESQFDPDFWSDYTILTPELDFNDVAKTVEANNEAEKLKEEIDNALRKFPKNDAARIDSILTFYNRKDLFNGNALIALDGEPIFQKSYSNSFVNNDSTTQFRIGSTAKTFASTLILMLENEGKLSLQDTLGAYIPNYLHGEVTIEQLLSHRSGIPNYLTNSDHLLKVFEEEITTEKWVELFGRDTLDFAPGTDFRYSNSGFLILAYVAEVVTGVDFNDLLQTKIFDSLGMTNTYSGTAADVDSMPNGYYYGQLEQRYWLENMKGAGGIVSTTGDLFKWSQALETEKLLPKEKLNEAYVPRAEYIGWDGDYGYGWMLDNYMFKPSKKHEIRYHPGTDLGFYSMFLKQPDEGITIILLSNTGDFPRFEITDLILNELN